MRQTRVDETTPGGTRGNGGHRGRLHRYLILMAAALAVAWTAGVGGVAAAAASTAATPHKAAAVKPATTPAGAPNLGPNVYIFSPSMPQSQIQATVDSISSQQISNQFGTQRYALLFEPGTYGSAADPLVFQVGYYTQVAGLGAMPQDTVINGAADVFNDLCSGGSCNADDNFWRSLSNLTLTVHLPKTPPAYAPKPADSDDAGCDNSGEFWAVSQAAPLRRVIINGSVAFQDYCAPNDFASGGFIADSQVTGKLGFYGNQQYLVRNSSIGG